MKLTCPLALPVPDPAPLPSSHAWPLGLTDLMIQWVEELITGHLMLHGPMLPLYHDAEALQVLL